MSPSDPLTGRIKADIRPFKQPHRNKHGGLGNSLVEMAESLPAEAALEQGAVVAGQGLVKGGEVAAEIAEGVEAVVHGNSKLSPRMAYLYRLFTKEGEFLKNGITQNLSTRYTRAFIKDKDLIRVDEGTRLDMLAKERQMTISNPGPLNKQSWAGTGP